ncbi:POTRA domain-containing protein [Xenorhabdus koppenhoeferi]|uniref:POTRA domain-containing protein n=1 Tax=Xenorhabdus koppenhoeferi TaxID=351659 RepID=UPI002B40E518|nr:POTRA domain-containing protein [Xenorhabdus sp. Vera]
MRDIEQGLEHLNRLSSSQFSIDIQAGIQPSYSTVHIKQQARHFPGKALLTLDNSGQKGAGQYFMSTDLVLNATLKVLSLVLWRLNWREW